MWAFWQRSLVMSSVPKCWRGVLWVRWCNGPTSSQPSMCWDTTSRSRFLSRSCTGRFRFDLFSSVHVIFKLQAELLLQCAILSVVWWCFAHPNLMWDSLGASVRESSVVLWKCKPLIILFSLCVEWKMLCWFSSDQRPNCGTVAHTLSAHLWPHTDKIFLLPAECRFSLRAWQHLYSLYTFFLPQLTNYSARHHKHKCLCHTHTYSAFQSDRSKNIRVLIVTLAKCNKRCSEGSRVQSCLGHFLNAMIFQQLLRLHAGWSGKWLCTRQDLLSILLCQWVVRSRSRQADDNVRLLLSTVSIAVGKRGEGIDELELPFWS